MLLWISSHFLQKVNMQLKRHYILISLALEQTHRTAATKVLGGVLIDSSAL